MLASSPGRSPGKRTTAYGQDPWEREAINWANVFDDLPPEHIQRLGDHYDAMPEGARQEYDRRYGRPVL